MANQETDRRVAIRDLVYVRGLREGGFGRVVLVRSGEEGNQRLMALKQQKRSSSSKMMQRTEQKILECVRVAPFCARLLASFQTADYVYLLTVYYSQGSLRDHMNLRTQFSGKQLTLMAAEMCEALFFLHKNHIIYRDMKPNNIVFDGRGHCALTDFGCAILNYEEYTSVGPRGTRAFWAPELFETPYRYNKMVDWWALGITLMTVVTSHNHIDTEDEDWDEDLESMDEMVRLLILGESAIVLQCGAYFAPLKRFIEDLLQIEPANRLGATEEQVRSHCLFKDNLLLDLFHWYRLRRRQMPPPLTVVPVTDGAPAAVFLSRRAAIRLWPDEDLEKEKEKYDRKVNLQEFTCVRGLGEGAFGRVVLVRRGEAGSQCLMALKQQKKMISLKKMILLEQMTLERARKAPFCVRLLASFQTADYAYLLTDYHSQQSLYDHIKLTTQFSGQQLTVMAAEMCEALLFLHKKHIIHCDVKPKNIMFEERGHCRLIDFGCALYNHQEYTYVARCGTAAYWAPELLNQQARYNKMVDWWALGVTLLTVVLSYNPMDAENADWDEYHEEIEENVTNFDLEETASAFVYGAYSVPLKQFVADLLQKDPADRLGGTEEQVRSHCLFKENNLLGGPDKWQLLRLGQMPPPLAVALKTERGEGRASYAAVVAGAAATAAAGAAAAAAVSQRGEDIQLWQDTSQERAGAIVYKDFDTCYFE